MVTQETFKIFVNPFWDDEYKKLNYSFEPFNDNQSLTKWRNQGYGGMFAGMMCDMRKPQPSWNNKFIDYFSKLGWKNIGTSYYRMDTGTILPSHSDLYTRYIEIFNLKGKEQSIVRAVIFLEDWKSGHYAEYDYKPFVEWRKGDCVYWRYDTPHMAANMGPDPRYTLQITGHL
jgi:hypothetical protein